MGYRLEIKIQSDLLEAENESFYGTKLYGYLENDEEEKLKSFNYIIELGYELIGCFDYGWTDPFDKKIVLNYKQLIKFIDLYLQDLKEKKDYNIEDETAYYIKDFNKLKQEKYSNATFYVSWC